MTLPGFTSSVCLSFSFNVRSVVSQPGFLTQMNGDDTQKKKSSRAVSDELDVDSMLAELDAM